MERTIECTLGSVPQEFSHIPSEWSRVIQCRGFPGKYNGGRGVQVVRDYGQVIFWAAKFNLAKKKVRM